MLVQIENSRFCTFAISLNSSRLDCDELVSSVAENYQVLASDVAKFYSYNVHFFEIGWSNFPFEHHPCIKRQVQITAFEDSVCIHLHAFRQSGSYAYYCAYLLTLNVVLKLFKVFTSGRKE